MCLLCKDLDFEQPHKVNQQEIKDNILKEIEEEEQRLDQYNVHQKELEERLRRERERRKVSYENYFNISSNCIYSMYND